MYKQRCKVWAKYLQALAERYQAQALFMKNSFSQEEMEKATNLYARACLDHAWTEDRVADILQRIDEPCCRISLKRIATTLVASMAKKGLAAGLAASAQYGAALYLSSWMSTGIAAMAAVNTAHQWYGKYGSWCQWAANAAERNHNVGGMAEGLVQLGFFGASIRGWRMRSDVITVLLAQPALLGIAQAMNWVGEKGKKVLNIAFARSAQDAQDADQQQEDNDSDAEDICFRIRRAGNNSDNEDEEE